MLDSNSRNYKPVMPTLTSLNEALDKLKLPIEALRRPSTEEMFVVEVGLVSPKLMLLKDAWAMLTSPRFASKPACESISILIPSAKSTPVKLRSSAQR